MRHAHTVEQVRRAEATLMAALPPGALMQRAATGLAHAVLDLLGGGYGRRVLLLVGSGDNGGDALVAGAALARRGVAVEAVLLGSRVHEEGLAGLRATGGRVVAVGEWTRPDVVVDGIVGIGGRGGLRPDAADVVARLAGVPMVAVDVPSGVEVDSGEVDGPHVSADLTVTFGTHKVAHLADPAASACGAVHLVDIGLDLPAAALGSLQVADVARLLPPPEPHSHKYTRGVVGVRAGSATYPGAAVLAVSGAACGLAGMVRLVGDDAVADRVRDAFPEVVGAGQVQAWVVGPGGGDEAGAALAAALRDGVPVVVDADALAHVEPAAGAPLVLTPHAGELARMVGAERADVEARPLRHARSAAERYDAVVLLKGRHTVVAAPDGTAFTTPTGVPWLATAGAGDVLAGLIGALLATGLPTLDAAAVGSWVHGAAATLASGGGPVVARDVAAAIPHVVRELR